MTQGIRYVVSIRGRDKPVGRKQVLTAPPVKRTAMAHGIPVFQPGTLRDAAQAENIPCACPPS